MKNFLVITLLASAVLLFSYSVSYALKVIPPRVVMGPDKDIEYVYIKNNSNAVKRYRFGWRHIAMEPNGKVVNLDRAKDAQVVGYRPVDDIIRFSPRSTVLQPGETQRVTLMVRRTPDLQDGEYRSHFIVEQIPNNKAKEEVSSSVNNSNKVQIDMLVSRAFPVYVFNGEVSASLNLTRAVLIRNSEKKTEDDPDHFVQFDVEKEGNRSIIASVEVVCGTGEGAAALSKVPKAVAVYAEGKRRSEKIPVFLPDTGCTSPRIILKAHRDDLLSGTVLAEGSVVKQ
jgi:hypothetical protein